MDTYTSLKAFNKIKEGQDLTPADLAAIDTPMPDSVFNTIVNEQGEVIKRTINFDGFCEWLPTTATTENIENKIIKGSNFEASLINAIKTINTKKVIDNDGIAHAGCYITKYILELNSQEEIDKANNVIKFALENAFIPNTTNPFIDNTDNGRVQYDPEARLGD